MKKIYRSRSDCKVFGLCGGLAEAINVDPTVLRLIVVITAFFTAGTTIMIYLIASMVIPKEPVGSFEPPLYGGGGNGYYNNGNSYNNGNGYNPSYNQPNNYYGTQPPPRYNYNQPPPQSSPQPPPHSPPPGSYDARQASDQGQLDDMLKDIEKKALEKEIQELKNKLAKYEKGE